MLKSTWGEIDTDDDELDATIWCWTSENSLFYLRKICQKAANDMKLWETEKFMQQKKTKIMIMISRKTLQSSPICCHISIRLDYEMISSYLTRRHDDATWW